METEENRVAAAVRKLVDDYRARCLWFLREDYYPATREERLRILEYIERHGDREAYRKAGAIRQMALTELQRKICRLIAENRIAIGESYVAGGAALNELMAASRISRDIHLFHDTEEALETSWRKDRLLLEEQGYEVRVIRDRPSFVEARVFRGEESVLMQWARDSVGSRVRSVRSATAA